jgi:N utilization substance protein B
MSKASRVREGRVRARRCAVQALYQWQIQGGSAEKIVAEFEECRELIKVDLLYFSQLVCEVASNFSELKEDLSSCLDMDWERLDLVETSVLLLSAYEMRFCQDVPYQVVINEGIELCKMFGTVEGFRFINGSLDKLARSLRPVECKVSA